MDMLTWARSNDPERAAVLLFQGRLLREAMASVTPKGTTSLSALGPVIEQAGDAQTTGDKAA